MGNLDGFLVAIHKFVLAVILGNLAEHGGDIEVSNAANVITNLFQNMAS